MLGTPRQYVLLRLPDQRAEITTNDVFSSTNVMLLGLMLLALHVAGIGSGWSGRRR
ncbi:hypothetical protein QA860_37905 [Streptomyces stelliscabiei]|uniref:hypothetical protein n=1 Tax=Streptomyces stelliscabiei TaxID=146820 RepID=UPI002FEF4FEF